MNEEQLEELEALKFLFLDGEIVTQEENTLELQISIPELETRPFIVFQIIWPQNYPADPLLFTFNDSRLRRSTKEAIAEKINKIVHLN